MWTIGGRGEVSVTNHNHRNLGGSRRLLTAAETAALLNVPLSSLYQCWRRWGLTAFRIGKALRFRESDVLLWIEDQAA
jgi:excisionase family DNA binding protein